MTRPTVVPDEERPSVAAQTPPGGFRERLGGLCRSLFPEPPEAPSSARRRLLGRVVTALTALAAVPLVASRLPVDRWDSLWAEDGSVFLVDGLGHGPWASITTPYAGYLNLYPRLSTELVTLLPLTAAGLAYTMLAAVALVWVAWTVWSCSAGQLTSPWLRAVLTAAVLLVPAGGLEPAGNVSNSHFFLVFGAYWALVGRPRSLPAVVSAHALVLVATLTDPICLGLLPLAVLRLICLKGMRDRSIALTYAAGMVVQLLVVLSAERPTGAAPAWGDIVFGYGFRVVSPSFLGLSSTQSLVDARGTDFLPYLAAVVAVLLLIGLVLEPRLRLPLVAAAVASLAVWVATAVVSLGGGYPPTGPGRLILDAASRYTIIPSLLLVSAWLLAAQSALRRVGPRWGVLVVVLAAAPVLTFGVTDFRPGSPVRPDLPVWSMVVHQAEEGCAASPAREPAPIPIPPGGAWRVALTCDELE